MNILARIKQRWRTIKIRQQLRERVESELLTPGGFMRASKELDCMIKGHLWTTDIDPKGDLSKETKRRTYCKHCGVYYHTHKYHKI